MEKTIWNPLPKWFQDMKEQYNILHYKIVNGSITPEERDAHGYLQTVIHDINNLIGAAKTYKELLEQQDK